MNISKIEKIGITKHLAVMLKSGITLSESIYNLADGAKSADTKKILNQIGQSINNGSSFNDALNKFPKIFDEFYRGIIRVGESTGRLDSSLAYLAEQMNLDYSIEKKVKGALMYPALVLSTTIALGAYISLFILPKLVDFFTAFESKLPASTIFLLKTALFMKQYGVLVFSLLAIFIFVLTIAVQLNTIKPYWHNFILRLPLFGNLIKEREIARFSRNLGTLIKSGLPVFEALEITAKSQTNIAYRQAIEKLFTSLEKGKNIAEVIKNSVGSFLFPRLVSDMIAVGEKTGTIDESLIYVSQFYEEDIEETARNLTNILEPAILVIIGLVVAFMALAIISPIYQLTGAIG